MVDIRHLKCLAQRACEFESRPGHKFKNLTKVSFLICDQGASELLHLRRDENRGREIICDVGADFVTESRPGHIKLKAVSLDTAFNF